MALENFVIHDIAGGEFDTTTYLYHQIMFGGLAEAVLNGTTVAVSGAITINLRIRTAIHSSGAAVYALGYQMAIEPLPLHEMTGGFR